MSAAAWGLCGVVFGWAVAQGIIELVRARQLRRLRRLLDRLANHRDGSGGVPG